MNEIPNPDIDTKIIALCSCPKKGEATFVYVDQDKYTFVSKCCKGTHITNRKTRKLRLHEAFYELGHKFYIQAQQVKDSYRQVPHSNSEDLFDTVNNLQTTASPINKKAKHKMYFLYRMLKGLCSYDCIAEEIEYWGGVFRDVPIGVNLLVLPDGSLFFVGNESAGANLCYRYYFNAKPMETCAGLLTPRCNLGLIYHNGWVYGFGGFINDMPYCKHAERYNLNDGTWQSLGELSSDRSNASCVEYKDKIYIIGGCRHILGRFIEIFDTVSMSYIDLNIQTDIHYLTDTCVASLYNDRIYIINKSCIIKFDPSKELLQIKKKDQEDLQCGSNIIQYKRRIYYYNATQEKIQRFHPRKMKLEYT